MLVKHRNTNNEDLRDRYILAMWLMFLRAPGRDTRDESGAYHLGEIGSDAPKNWYKDTPYSPAKRRAQK